MANIVVMPNIKTKNGIIRGKNCKRTDANFCDISRKSWEWWCAKNNATFILLETNYDSRLEDFAPTFQRWSALPALLQQYGNDSKVCFTDADTMIKWDTPNFFDFSPNDALTITVRKEHLNWCQNCINAYQPLFPDVQIDKTEIYNAGWVILTETHLPFIQEFLDFSVNHKQQLFDIQYNNEVGSDQTVFNFILKRMGLKVNAVSNMYNWKDTFRPTGKDPRGDTPERVAAKLKLTFDAATVGDTFKFVNEGYVWHFMSTPLYRAEVMTEVWSRVSKYYV